MRSHNEGNWKELFKAIKIGIIVIEKDELKVKRYNASAGEIFKRLSVGKSITDTAQEFIDHDVISGLKQIFEDFQPIKQLINTKEGHWYVIRFEPYTTSENVEYSILSFIDVTDLKFEFERRIESEKDLQREILHVEEEERWRLGKYLHDATAQNLLSIKMLLDLLKPKFKQLDKQTRQELKKVKRLVIKSEKNIRELSHFVLPIESESRITNAFQKLLDQVRELYDVECSFKMKNISHEIEDQTIISSLYYIAQEAIRNAIHHGQADSIEVSISKSSNEFHLVVTDNGLGYTNTKSSKDGRGINIMKHRAELLDGTVEIKEKSDDVGTEMICSIPIERIKEAQ